MENLHTKIENVGLIGCFLGAVLCFIPVTSTIGICLSVWSMTVCISNMLLEIRNNSRSIKKVIAPEFHVVG